MPASNYKTTHLLSIACIAVSVLFDISAVQAQNTNTDNVLLAADHVPLCAKYAALGLAGAAVPGGPECVLLNPSVFHAYADYNHLNVVSSVMYNSGETTFDRHAVNASFGARLTEAVSCGFVYRFLKQDSDNLNNQVVLSVSGRLFNKSISSGAVNAGINLKYNKLSWITSGFDTLFSTRRSLGITDTIGTSAAQFGNTERRTLALDIGLFQNEISEGLDFGLTFHNLLGYSWYRESPVKQYRDSIAVDSLSATSDTIRIAKYSSDISGVSDWDKKNNRRLTAGIAFHKEILEDKAEILLPFDLEIFNFLDFKTHQHFAIRTGIEVKIREKYCLRFGYARAPDIYPDKPDELKNENIFSGGAGVLMSSFAIDLYIRQMAWGIAGTVAF